LKSINRTERRPSSGRMHAHRFGQRGVTLVEIMVATLILGIVALGMAQFFANGRIGFDREERKRVATLLAQEALERTVALSYDQINAWSELRTIDTVDYRISILADVDVPERNMKTVTSTVSWRSMRTGARSATLVTMVYDN